MNYVELLFVTELISSIISYNLEFTEEDGKEETPQSKTFNAQYQVAFHFWKSWNRSQLPGFKCKKQVTECDITDELSLMMAMVIDNPFIILCRFYAAYTYKYMDIYVNVYKKTHR